MVNPTRMIFRTGATAASLGAFALEKTADILRSLAGEAQERAPELRSLAADVAEKAPAHSSGTDVPVEHKGRARKVEPIVAPEKQPDNPAAPAGADPDATSGTGPVPRRISNPKAARKVRKRAEKTADVSRLEAKTAKKGAKPSNGKAEASPAEMAKAGRGRAPAPMGSTDNGDAS